MNCHRVQSLLSAYLDQELSSEERRLIRNHIFNCPVCAQCLEELSRIKKYLGGLEPPPPQIDLIDHFFSYKLHISDAVDSNPWEWCKRLTLTAACIFLFLLTSFHLFPVTNTNRSIAGQEVEYHTYDQFTTYQLVNNEQNNNVNFFLEEDETEEKKKKKKKKKIDDFYLPQHKALLPGIPVSSR